MGFNSGFEGLINKYTVVLDWVHISLYFIITLRGQRTTRLEAMQLTRKSFP